MLTLQDIFGPSAVNDGAAHPNTTVTFKPSELPGVDDAAALSVEGLMLAILKRYNASVAADTGVKYADSFQMEPYFPNTILKQRGGDAHFLERYTATLFQIATDPNLLTP